MSELKKCPFCGGKAVTSTFFDWDDLEYMAFEVNDSESIDGEVTCENERCINGWYLSPKAWNTRPIEDALNARIAELEHDLTNKETEYTDLWDDALALQSRIAELEAAQRWIPVSERLPEANTPVLTISKDNDKPVTALQDAGFWWSNVDWALNVTHWMPLPTPPDVQE